MLPNRWRVDATGAGQSGMPVSHPICNIQARRAGVPADVMRKQRDSPIGKQGNAV